MGNLTLREIKKEVLSLLKPKMIKAPKDSEEYGWLRGMVHNLEAELIPKNIRAPERTLLFKEELIPICEKAGLDEYECKIFTVLWSNPDSTPSVIEIAMACDYDRGKTYRTLEHLKKYGLVQTLNLPTMRFRMTNTKHPFKPWCERKLEEIKHLESLSP